MRFLLLPLIRSKRDNLLDGRFGSVDVSTVVDEGEGSVTDSLGSVTPSPVSGATSSSAGDAVVDLWRPLPLPLNLESGLLNFIGGGGGLVGCLALGLLRMRLRRPLLGAGSPVSFPDTSFSSTGGSSGTS